MKKRVAALLALMMAAMLTACGGNSDTASEAPAGGEQQEASGDKVTIEFWHAWSGENGEKLEKAVADFNATHDNIEVVATNQGDYFEIYSKAMAAIGAGDAPDVLMIGTDNVGPYVADGLLEDLIPYMDESGIDKDDLVPAFTDKYWGDDGELYVLSWGRSCPVLFVNQDMLDEAGLQAPTTWDEMDEVSQKLIADGVTSYGYSMPYDSWFFLMIVPQMGGTLFNDDLTALGCVEDGTLAKGLQLYQDQVKDKTLYFGPTQDSNNACRSLFFNGESAMFLGSCANLAAIDENASFNYSMCPVPAGVRKAVNTGGCTFGMVSSSEHKEEAWEFMKWYMTAEEGGASIAAQTGYIPWTKSMAETQAVKDFWSRMPAAETAYQQILDCGEDSGRTIKTGEFTNDFMSALGATLYDLEDVNTVVQDLDREVKSALE